MEIQNLMNGISIWSSQQFSTLEGTRRIIAKLARLKKEATELQRAVDDDDKKEINNEIAACFVLLFDVAHDLNITESDIIEFSRAKIGINKDRK